jgi:hypothetical protein
MSGTSLHVAHSTRAKESERRPNLSLVGFSPLKGVPIIEIRL